MVLELGVDKGNSASDKFFSELETETVEASLLTTFLLRSINTDDVSKDSALENLVKRRVTSEGSKW